MADTDDTILDDSTAGGGSPGVAAAAAGQDASDAVYEAQIEVWAVLGKVSIPIRQLLRMGRGAVIALDRALDDSIEIRANNHLIARGDVVIVDEKIGVCITENVAADTARQNR